MKKNNIILAGSSLLGLAVSSPAWSQVGASAQPATGSVATDTSDAAETIIVTARRRDEDRQDVPLVINSVSQEQIQKLNFRSLQEVQSLVPGLNLSTQANGTGGNVSLRGVNYDVNASGNNATVEFYYNDAPIGSGVLLQSLFDISQIEVLRGPQGTLRGRASPSGSITVTTRRPDLYKSGGNLNMSGNDIGTINLNGGLGIPIIKGIAAIRVAGVIERNDYDRVKTLNSSLGRSDPYSQTKGGRVSGRIQPFDALTLDGSYQRLERTARSYDQFASYSEVNPAAAASPLYIASDDRKSLETAQRAVRQTYDIFNGQAQLRLAGQRFVYVFQHNKQHFNFFTPTDLANFFPTRRVGNDTETIQKQTSHEVRLQNDEPLFGFVDYVIGGLDIKARPDSNLINRTVVALPSALGGSVATVANTPIVRNAQSHEQSIFGNLTVRPFEKLEISGGGRYISYKSSGLLNINNATIIPDPKINDDHFIYSASVKYSVTPDVMVYANTGSSYRPAIFAIGDFSVQPSVLQRSFTALPPESSKSYELGFKSSLFDKRLRLNATAFHQTFKNFPYRTPGAGVYYVNYNSTTTGGVTTVTPTVSQFNFVAAVPVRINGVEGEIAFSPSRNWDIGLVASYALGKIKGGSVPCNDLNGDGVPDSGAATPTLAQLQAVVGANNLSSCKVTQRASFQPPFSATFQTEYRHPVFTRTDAYLRALYTFYGSSQVDPTFAFDNVRKYGLLNLYAGLRGSDGRWELALFSKNLLDTFRTLTRTGLNTTSYQVLQPPTFRTTAAANAGSTYNTITSTAPREFGVSLRYNFGNR